MQVETYEINGFEIDEFNVYKLEEGKTQGICPLCSHDRKAANKKLKCASYDWKRGLGTCHNCNQTFQMHTFKRKGDAIKEYTKPEVREIDVVVWEIDVVGDRRRRRRLVVVVVREIDVFAAFTRVFPALHRIHGLADTAAEI